MGREERTRGRRARTIVCFTALALACERPERNQNASSPCEPSSCRTAAHCLWSASPSPSSLSKPMIRKNRIGLVATVEKMRAEHDWSRLFGWRGLVATCVFRSIQSENGSRQRRCSLNRAHSAPLLCSFSSSLTSSASIDTHAPCPPSISCALRLVDMGTDIYKGQY
jgi:hypothetical protein